MAAQNPRFLAAQETDSGGASNSSAVITKPTGAVSGDVLIATIGVLTTRTISNLNGWTQIGSTFTGFANTRVFVVYRVLTDSDVSTTSWTITLSGTSIWATSCAAYSCVNTSSPIGNTNTASGSSVSSLNAGSISTQAANSLVVLMVIADPNLSSPTFTPATGYTERIDSAQIEIQDHLYASAGSIGANSVGCSVSSSMFIMTVELLAAQSARFYMPATGAQAVSVSAAAEWEQTTGAKLAPLNFTNGGSTIATTTITEPGNSTSNQDYLAGQFVSNPIAAQTIAGYVRAQVRTLESAIGANGAAQILIRVVSGDGITVRGTLYAGDLEVLSGNPATEFVTSLTDRRFPRIASNRALSSVVSQDGDRIVVEIGVREHNTVSTAFTYGFSFGESAGSDLAEDDTTTTANNPWIEFSQQIIFDTLITPPSGGLVIAGTAPAAQLLENIPPASLAITGIAPTVTVTSPGITIAVPAGALAIAGVAPAGVVGPYAQPAAGALTIAGTAPGAQLLENVPAGALSVAGIASASVLGPYMTPAAGVLAIAATAPAVQLLENVPAGSVSIAGIAPGAGADLGVPAGAVTAAGLAPGLQTSTGVPAGALQLVGIAPGVLLLLFATPAPGVLAVAGVAPGVALDVGVPVGVLAVAGLSPTITTAITASPGPGVLTAAGVAPGLALDVGTPAGAIALTGQPAAVQTACGTPPGTLAISSTAPALVFRFAVSPPVGVLAIVGQAPSATVTGSGVNVLPGLGTVTADGLAPGLQIDVRTAAGVLTATGTAPGAQLLENVPAGALSVAGLAPDLAFRFTLSPGAGALTVAGVAPAVAYNVAVQPGPGTLTATGAAPGVQLGVGVPAGVLAIAGRAPSVQLLVGVPVGALVFVGIAPNLGQVLEDIEHTSETVAAIALSQQLEAARSQQVDSIGYSQRAALSLVQTITAPRYSEDVA